MSKLNIFIYRPDKFRGYRIPQDAVFTIKGQPLAEYQRDMQIVYEHRVDTIKNKIYSKPKHKVPDYWR